MDDHHVCLRAKTLRRNLLILFYTSLLPKNTGLIPFHQQANLAIELALGL